MARNGLFFLFPFLTTNYTPCFCTITVTERFLLYSFFCWRRMADACGLTAYLTAHRYMRRGSRIVHHANISCKAPATPQATLETASFCREALQKGLLLQLQNAFKCAHAFCARMHGCIHMQQLIRARPRTIPKCLHEKRSDI